MSFIHGKLFFKLIWYLEIIEKGYREAFYWEYENHKTPVDHDIVF